MAALTVARFAGQCLAGQRGPSFIGKLGFDRQCERNLRVRLTGSMYRNEKSLSNTLYGGDRAGSRYYYVLENRGDGSGAGTRASSIRGSRTR